MACRGRWRLVEEMLQEVQDQNDQTTADAACGESQRRTSPCRQTPLIAAPHLQPTASPAGNALLPAPQVRTKLTNASFDVALICPVWRPSTWLFGRAASQMLQRGTSCIGERHCRTIPHAL